MGPLNTQMLRRRSRRSCAAPCTLRCWSWERAGLAPPALRGLMTPQRCAPPHAPPGELQDRHQHGFYISNAGPLRASCSGLPARRSMVGPLSTVLLCIRSSGAYCDELVLSRRRSPIPANCSLSPRCCNSVSLMYPSYMAAMSQSLRPYFEEFSSSASVRAICRTGGAAPGEPAAPAAGVSIRVALYRGPREGTLRTEDCNPLPTGLWQGP